MHEAGRSYRMSELLATYILADPGCDAEKRAEQIAIGLTVGSWTDLPLLKQEQLKKHKGRVVNVEETESELGKNRQRSPSPIRKPILQTTFPLC